MINGIIIRQKTRQNKKKQTKNSPNNHQVTKCYLETKLKKGYHIFKRIGRIYIYIYIYIWTYKHAIGCQMVKKLQIFISKWSP